MDNHVHLLLKVDTESAREWSPCEVARRWLGLHPPRDGYRRRVEVEDEHIDAPPADTTPGLIESLRGKLTSISVFMKEFKQEVTQEINRLEETIGSVWAGRFKVGRVTDEAQLLTTLVYIDLNPFAGAGLCAIPEAGEHTSLAARLRGTSNRTSTNRRAHCHPKPPAASSASPPPERSGWWMTVGGAIPAAAPPPPVAHARHHADVHRLPEAARPHGPPASQSKAHPGQRLPADPRPPVHHPGRPGHHVGEWFERGLPWERPRSAT